MSTADIQLSVVFGGQYSFEKLQSDWEQTDPLERDFIKNKPDLVNFEAETVTAETVIFNENPTNPVDALKLQYNPNEKTIEFGLTDGGTLQIGKEMFEEYTNIDTVPLTNGMIVSTAAISGNRKGVKRTDFTSLTSIRSIVGMVTVASIGTNQSGRVTTKGIINDLNTNGIGEGSQLWGNPSVLGGWSGSKPAKPQYAVQIGQVVVAHATVGSIELNIAKDVKFSDLADVNGSTNLIDNADTIPKRDADGIIREISVADIKADFKADTDLIYEPLLGFTPENTANKGQANGYASLGADGLVPSNQLPSFVDDVLEFANLAEFPVTGEQGKIYVALDTNKTYRWSGSTYIYITSGAVDSVAGKTGVVTLVKADVGLGNVDNTSDVNKPVSTLQAAAIATKVGLTGNETIAGVKTFSSSPIVPNPTAAGQALNKGTADGAYVGLTGAQNVAGVKTFTDSPVVPTPVNNTDAANKEFVESAVVDSMPAATTALLPQLAYKTRVDADAGLIKDLNHLTELYIKNLSLLDSTVFLWNGEAGTKQRTSGSNTFASKLYNMANKVQQFGPELVTNGTFTTDTSGWTGTAGTLSVDAQRLKITNTSSDYRYATQILTTVIGKTYHLLFSFTKVNVYGNVRVANTANNAVIYEKSESSSVTKTISFVAQGVQTTLLFFTNSGTIGEYTLWDNISVKQMDWIEGTNDAVQTTEANQPYMGGLIAPNEKLKIKSFRGLRKYLSFSPISISDGQQWSITYVANSYTATSTEPNYLIGVTFFLLSGSLYFRSASGVLTMLASNYPLNKQVIVTVASSGSTNIVVYINGIIVSTVGITDNSFSAVSISRNDTNEHMNGTISHVQIHNRALSASEIQAQHDFLRLQIPEIEGVAIGNQYWATSNYEGVVAGDGSIIPEVQESNNVEKIADVRDREFSEDTGWWTKQPPINGITEIAGGVARVNSIDGSIAYITKKNFLVVGKWYKYSFEIVGTPTGVGQFGEGVVVVSINSSTTGIKTGFFKADSPNITFKRAGICDFTIDNISIEEVGWSQSTTIYDSVYAATSGTAAQKELAALKAAAMWCYHNNDVNNGAIYGKMYNWYAVKLISLYPPQGWRVPSSVDFVQLINYLGGTSVAGGKAKALYGGFNNSFSTNESGFSAIGSGRRGNDGAFTLLNIRTSLSSIESVYSTYDDSTVIQAILAYSASSNSNTGTSIRLLRNSPVGPNEKTITSTTIVSDIASTANSTQIPFGYSVASIRLKTTANLTNIKVELWNNFYSGTPTLVSTLITGKTANNTTMVFHVLADAAALLQDGTLRITATGAATFETVVEYNLQKNTF